MSSPAETATATARRADWLYERLARLAQPRARRFVIGAALLLVVPSAFSGLVYDDYVLQFRIEHPHSDQWAGSSPFDLYRWFDAGHVGRLIDGAGLAWWTSKDAEIAFMRPVSSATHALDHVLWPHSAIGMHLQSMLWFALLLVMAAKTYAELVDNRWVAGVAAAMFALDSAHGMEVGWISNRNALIGGAFAYAALIFHHWRRSGQGYWFGPLAWLCFALGLLSAELALGIAGYLFGYALFLDRGTLWQRARSLVPYAVISVAWYGVHNAAHYGVAGFGAYVDPIRELPEFVELLPSRVLVMLSSQVSRLWSDLYVVAVGPLRASLLLCAIAVCALTLWFAWPSLRTERAPRFWLCGTFLSVLPLAVGLPSDRLLTLAGLGVMPFLAQAIHDAITRTRAAATGPGRAATVRYPFAVGLLVVHLVLDPLALPALALTPAASGAWANAAEASLPSDASLPSKTVIIAKVPDSLVLTYLPVMRAVKGKPAPGRLYWMLSTAAAVRIERRGPNLLRVTADQGFFDWDERGLLSPMHAGDHVSLSEMSATVLEINQAGRPTVCDFAFARPLESEHYEWFSWKGGRLEPLPVPRAGQTTTLPAN